MEIEVEEGATAQNIIAQLEIPPELANLVMVNGYHLLPEEIKNRPLKAGETISIFPPVAGG
jgi:molybdopterin converting factor small subunit